MPQVKLLYRAWVGRLQVAVLGLIVGSIVALLIRLWNQITQFSWRFNLWYLMLSVLLVTVGIWGWAIVWAWMLQKLGEQRLSMHQAISIYIYSNIAKYVPGAIWNYLARAHLGHKQGISIPRIWTASFIEIVGSLCTGLILYGASLLWPHIHQPFLPIRVIFILITVLLIAISPPAFRVYSILVKRLYRNGKTNPEMPNLVWRDLMFYIGLSCITWLLIGLAFYLLLLSVYAFPLDYLPEAIGTWSFSVIAGLVAIGVPQGIGVKEGFLVVTLSARTSLPVALSISVLSRIWLVVCELVSALVWGLANKILTFGMVHNPEKLD